MESARTRRKKNGVAMVSSISGGLFGKVDLHQRPKLKLSRGVSGLNRGVRFIAL